MAADPFADLIPGAKTGPRAPTRARANEVQLRGAEASIDSARASQAVAGETLKSAPIDRARDVESLAVQRATRDAEIRKAIATADSAELELEIKRLASKYPNVTSDQITTAARYNLMKQGNDMYENALRKGYKPDALGNKVTYLLDKIPGIGTDVASMLRNETAQEAQLGARIFGGGALRQETGAGGPQGERPEIMSRYFTTPFMPDTKTLRGSLSKLRKQQIETARRASGPLAVAESLPPQAISKLKEGVVTTFGNGQKWTLRNKQPVQVQ